MRWDLWLVDGSPKNIAGSSRCRGTVNPLTAGVGAFVSNHDFRKRLLMPDANVPLCVLSIVILWATLKLPEISPNDLRGDFDYIGVCVDTLS